MASEKRQGIHAVDTATAGQLQGLVLETAAMAEFLASVAQDPSVATHLES